ncbi:MAG TPA: DNA polymerase Y family protein [Steroidobacteraceae bacterium]|nr:DNA polymerase Y family protein [Steroidobacteraceae bacterium]
MPLPVSAPRPEPRPKRSSTPLQPVVSPKRFPGAAPVSATELWIGVHLSEPAEQALSRQQLERLAVRAQRFTPRVSLVPPDGLVLEVKGSLHLFNGVEGLSRALVSECTTLGLKPMVALAPTPLAALVAARSGKPGSPMGQPGRPMGQPGGPMGQPFVVTELTRLVGQLMPLSLVVLRWPEEVLERLARMGVRTIGQVLRLPRAGFARRFGTEALTTLDRLTGRGPDLRERFRARERFRCRRELTYELENHTAILGELAPLLAELGKFLEARQCGVTKLECLLRHRHAEPTRCVLRLATPVADVRRLTELLGERLSALALPEPVRGCELRSGPLELRVLASNSVWQPGEHGGAAGAEAPELIERLRARLGPEAVYGLRVLPGHRPENAWGIAEPAAGHLPGAVTRRAMPGGRSTPGGRSFARPLWLLPAPRLLRERDGLPRRRGPLLLHGEPERLETGWWDGGDIARDYYTATDLHGVRLWIFREREVPHRWFLHGVFGGGGCGGEGRRPAPNAGHGIGGAPLCGAALRNELYFPARRLTPSGARRASHCARLYSPGHHR